MHKKLITVVSVTGAFALAGGMAIDKLGNGEIDFIDTINALTISGSDQQGSYYIPDIGEITYDRSNAIYVGPFGKVNSTDLGVAFREEFADMPINYRTYVDTENLTIAQRILLHRYTVAKENEDNDAIFQNSYVPMPSRNILS